MNCGCSMGYETDYDGVPAVLWHERQVERPRKAHSCVECGKTIPVGERCCMATSTATGGMICSWCR